MKFMIQEFITAPCEKVGVDLTDYFRSVYYAKYGELLVREVFQVDVHAFERAGAIPRYVRDYLAEMKVTPIVEVQEVCLECFKPLRQLYSKHADGYTCCRFCKTLYLERKVSK